MFKKPSFILITILFIFTLVFMVGCNEKEDYTINVCFGSIICIKVYFLIK